ncbi:MAG: hypothetical protein MJ182_01960 [Treponema sp.]|nr:hypothetical protein [Treponema sp.]
MKLREISITILVFLTVIFPLSFVIFTYISLQSIKHSEEIPKSKCHILVIGKTENNNFLNNVYKGANSVSDRYDAVVELHVPASKAEESSLSSLFEYASFVNADGIIAYINENSEKLLPPVKSDGSPIPVVTVGTFDQEIEQISFIGNNYSESGRLLARTAIEEWQNGMNFFVINSAGKNPNYSNLMNTLSVTLRNARLTPVIFESSLSENQESLSKELLYENAPPAVIICLTEDDSIRTSQIASDPNYNSKNKIISFGENETISTYLNKGIIHTVISVDQENTGARAMKEIFDYKKNKFANSYVYAGLQIKKGEKKK